jgi:ABC-type transporter MlaC component
MKNRRHMKKFFNAVAIAMTLLVAGIAFAGAATDAVKEKQEELFEVIAQKKTESRDAKLKSLFDEMLAYDVFAKDSLGKKWKTLTNAEQKQFSTRLTRLVRCNYKRNLVKMLDYNIVYVGEESKRDATLVKSRARHKTKKREPEIEIDFLMDKLGGKYKAIDIYTERASLTRTYRSQFLRILKKEDGFKKLLEKMDKKIEKDHCD